MRRFKELFTFLFFLSPLPLFFHGGDKGGGGNSGCNG